MSESILQIELDLTADKVVQMLLGLSETEQVCFLDSCDVSYLNSHLLLAGINPIKTHEITDKSAKKTLEIFNKIITKAPATIFTISYDFGLKLENIGLSENMSDTFTEPDIFIAVFDSLVIHDYNSQKTYLRGNSKKFDEITRLLTGSKTKTFSVNSAYKSEVFSNFSKLEYITKIRQIHEYIRQGDTYQTNLTQQFQAKLPDKLTPQQIFWNLRKQHPAPFASFISRKNGYVVSISPERFLRVEGKRIETSPIKGTRRRGHTGQKDAQLKSELIGSGKDRAENTMIVDLLRNDLGRICEFGSVKVEKFCDLEEHPTLFHLVSTVSGQLKKNTDYADIIKSMFPCGSITGCPKISTMKIINELETVRRGLSMGAIGFCGFDKTFDLNVAIRTMVVRKNKAIFNVGGGIVIDSNPADEYDESLLKAKALFKALGITEF